MKCKHLGLMGNIFRMVPGLDAVFGYDVAVNDIFRGIFRWSSLEQVTCFYDPYNSQDLILKKKYRSLSRQSDMSVKMNLFSEFDFLKRDVNTGVDVLHSASMEFMPLVYVREFFSPSKCPVTYTIHGASYPNYIEGFYLMKLLMPFRPYDSLICTSHSVKYTVNRMLTNISELLGRHNGIDIKYQGRLDVVPLGVDTEKFTPLERSVVRDEFHIAHDAFVILWIGRFSTYDKADLYPLLQVFKRLLKKNPGKKLQLILAGYDRRNLPQLPLMKKYTRELGIDSHVHFFENHDMANRNRLFSCADVFTSPIDNVQETFGLTPIEAMACGIPQVVSDWNGYRDTVVDGVTGFLIPTYWSRCDEDIQHAALLPTDANYRTGLHHLLMGQSVAVDLNEYEKALQSLMDNPDLKRQMSQQSVQRAREKFSWQVIVRKYEELWTELLRIKQKVSTHDMRDQMRFIQPIYCSAFAKYPKMFLDDDVLLKITEDGKQLLEDGVPFPWHYDIEKLLPKFQITNPILNIVLAGGNKGVKMTDIIASFGQDYNSSLLRRSIMWLVKQGFVSVLF
ncbi:glycosyltransferase family 4 protein [Acidobacteriota bacterium]